MQGIELLLLPRHLCLGVAYANQQLEMLVVVSIYSMICQSILSTSDCLGRQPLHDDYDARGVRTGHPQRCAKEQSAGADRRGN
jgi:hypothetical protein